MSTTNRTVGIIDAEINAIKDHNPNWVADNVDKALITALTVEKNQLSTAPATQPPAGNNPVPVTPDFPAIACVHIFVCLFCVW
jgi:hypothetical protein